MNGKKAFFYSFLISMAVVLAGFGCVYVLTENMARETDTPQYNVPKAFPGAEDSKTLLLCVDSHQPFFFVFKFNAIENRVGVVALSPSFQLKKGASLQQIFERTGAMQCLMDLKEEFGMEIHYYLQCTWQQLGQMCRQLTDIGIDSLGQNIPDYIRNYLLKGAERLDGQSLVNRAEKAAGFLDNELGLAFLTQGAVRIVENNMARLSDGPAKVLKEGYSGIVTNINTQALKGLGRITDFLGANYVEYDSTVILNKDTSRQEKMDSVIQ